MTQKRVLIMLCLWTALTASACRGSSSAVLEPVTPRPVAPGAMPVVIDTDMAADDWLAMLYLMGRADVDVQAITVTGAGEAHCAAGVRNALDLATLAGRPGIPVACGRETPLAGDHVFPAHWRERVDNLFGLSLPRSAHPPVDESAAELLIQVVRGSPQQVHLIALGPLTNVAEALQAERAIAGNLEMITIMGGAVRVPGNVGPSSDIANDVAEWNIYVDPRAAAIVLASGAPLTLVPLDATNHAPLTMGFYRRLKRDRTTSVAEFTYRVLAQNEDWIRSGGTYFWDPLAVVLATEESVGTFEELPLAVIEEEGAQSGRTLVRQDGHSVRVAVGADGDRFETLFLDVLNGRRP